MVIYIYIILGNNVRRPRKNYAFHAYMLRFEIIRNILLVKTDKMFHEVKVDHKGKLFNLNETFYIKKFLYSLYS